MSATTEIEKKNLEAHVELCAERYKNLDEKLSNLDQRMTMLERHIVDIKESITNKTGGMDGKLIAIGTTLLGAMFSAIIVLLINFINK